MSMSTKVVLMSIRAVVFDLDGTLLNTITDIADALNEALAQHQFPTYTYDEVRYLIGGGIERLVRRGVPAGTSESIFQAVLTTTRSIYDIWLNRSTCPYQGIIELLERLTLAGVKTAIVTNKPHHAALLCVEKFFSNHPFFAVEGDREGFPLKPDPQALLPLLERMGVTPNETLYVGDSDVDMQISTASGVCGVGVLWGFRDESELLANGASFIVSEPIEIATIAGI